MLKTRVAGSGKVSGPGCRDCGAPTPHTLTRIVKFRDHTKVIIKVQRSYKGDHKSSEIIFILQQLNVQGLPDSESGVDHDSKN